MVFQEQEFDITLMDIKMPGMNGVASFLELCKLKPDAKVVMMTGYSVSSLIRQAEDNGALSVLHKPIDMSTLMRFIDNARPHAGDILLVDDDVDFLQTTEEILLLDLRMPVKSGLDVYMELKKRNQLVPTIIMTAFHVEESATIDLLQSFNSTAYLRKPFKPLELIDLIEAIVQHENLEL